MKRTKRTVTDNAEEAAQHRRIMEADGWAAHRVGEDIALSTKYTLELAEEDAL